jgi:transposase
MITVELYARIKRPVMVDGLSRREAAKQFGVHRNAIAKMLQYSAPPGYRWREQPEEAWPIHPLDRRHP